VLGTRSVAEMADKYRSETFILISTDKAVNPTSVMGASKRMSELVMQDISQNSSTNFAAVRFGNVLGSRGSVIPTFERQIERGGPVTVTHPNMKRYFMTICEAVQLVLQAGALTKGGEIFVLDMGEPVKIDDLARDLIRLYGLQPGIDIEIVYTGIRPGEKMYEELFSNSEEMEATRHERIFISRKENKSDYAGINQQLDVWVRNNYFDSEAIIDLLYNVVPEYKRHRASDKLKLIKKDTKIPG
jgi:FlaA1/EpsC-like NDP-sugar epimerase